MNAQFTPIAYGRKYHDVVKIKGLIALYFIQF